MSRHEARVEYKVFDSSCMSDGVLFVGCQPGEDPVEAALRTLKMNAAGNTQRFEVKTIALGSWFKRMEEFFA